MSAETPATSPSVSRSERLLQLIENVSIATGVKLNAASQLGSYLDGLYRSNPDIAPTQSNQVLNRLVKIILSSKSWEVRTAAGFAIEKVMNCLQEASTCHHDAVTDEELNSLGDFNLDSFIDTYEPLVASSGAEFELDLTSMSSSERMRQMRGELQKTLGGMQGVDDAFAAALVDESDFNPNAPNGNTVAPPAPAAEELSSREKAMLRRRKSSARPNAMLTLFSDKAKLPKQPLFQEDHLKTESELNAAVRLLMTFNANMHNAIWTVRHGALLGILSVLKGCTSKSDDQNKMCPFLLASILRGVLILLGLDRFSDFVGDQTIAPIRETAAQCLSLLLGKLPAEYASMQMMIWNMVLNLTKHAIWQVRLSGMLALKYILAVDESLGQGSQEQLLSIGLEGCADMDEDIRCLAATLLTGLVKSELITALPKLKDVSKAALSFLIPDDRHDGDGDNSSTMLSGLELIGGLLGKSLLPRTLHTSLVTLLVSHIRHPLSGVRLKVLELLSQIECPNDRLVLLFRCLVQCIILDDSDHIRRASFRLASSLCQKITKSGELLSAIVNLSSIALTPLGQAYQIKHFCFVSPESDNLDDDAGDDDYFGEIKYRIVNTPAAHELGFKMGDVMILNGDVVLEGRRMASRLLSSLLTSHYDGEVAKKIAATLTGTDPQSKCVSLWIFGQASPVETKSVALPDSRENLWDSRLYLSMLTTNVITLPASESVITLLEQETLFELQSDLAMVIKGRSIPISQLLTPVINQEYRKQALRTLSLAYSDSTPLPTTTTEIIAFYLVAASAGDKSRVKEFINFVAESMSSLETSLILDDDALWEGNLLADVTASALSIMPKEMLGCLLESCMPILKASTKDSHRLRILSLLKHLFTIDEMAEYAMLFLVPVLGKMADSCEAVRSIAAPLFSQLVRLVPLKMSSPSGWSPAVEGAFHEAQMFLSQFMGDSVDDLLTSGHKRIASIPDFALPVPINADLRPYQRAGINWLAFLARYGLNGALCDDMGLGKTLQTISMLASDHYLRQNANLPPLSSLVICPSSLLGHWEHEIQQYAPSLGVPHVYCGSLNERRRSATLFEAQKPNILVTSYEVARSDVAYLQGFHWNYIVLDEGHVIKNPKTKLTLAIKSLPSEHRLLLSGTPIQNNIIELWSLFDFLMPGMLGSEADFMESYGKAIMAVQPVMRHGQAQAHSSNQGAGVKEWQIAETKLKQLHKQVLPFILRRMKEDVLKDLPPKIIQDYECEASPIQKLLYDEHFNASLRHQLHSLGDGDGGKAPLMHVFQSLQYLRKICVHPASVLDPEHPLWDEVQECLKHMQCHSLEDLAVSPKLLMLKELLEDCGIGGRSTSTTGDDESMNDLGLGGGDGHRVLIFAQHKSTLDLIERLVFKRHMPSVRYLRLDGDVEAKERFTIAQRFNADPSIDCLLLTTQVGGLGLNLTGADTVIFIEHDWNPMKDLQAMDRAHRLGQKRVVTVYRLIVRDTLEQQILGLQQWKTKVAATIVQQQDLTGDKDTMAKANPVNLLDLLNTGGSVDAPSAAKKAKTTKEEDRMAKWMDKHVKIVDNPTGYQAEDYYDEYVKAFDLSALKRSH